ncbi:MAG: glycosyltransferase, partial [Acidobacteriales bacterium]|nr:glycosyltransferase [Terriglobales bacterium]
MLRRKISIHTLGTRGDVQPYIGLAEALMAAGYEVLLVAPEQFETFVHGHDIAFFPLPGEFLELLNSPEGKKAIGEGSGFGSGFKLLKHIRPLLAKLFDAELKSAQEF